MEVGRSLHAKVMKDIWVAKFNPQNPKNSRKPPQKKVKSFKKWLILFQEKNQGVLKKNQSQKT